jgi:microcystin-dependent protein
MIIIGTIITFAGNSWNTTVWRECNGASLNKNDFPDLYNAIGTAYGGYGNYFNLPDLRGYITIGGSSATVIRYGTDKHKLIGIECPSHMHYAYRYNLTHNIGGSTWCPISAIEQMSYNEVPSNHLESNGEFKNGYTGSANRNQSPPFYGRTGYQKWRTTDNDYHSGTYLEHENRQPYIELYKLIRVKKS